MKCHTEFVEHIPDRMPEYLPDRMSEQMSDRMLAPMPRDVPDRQTYVR